MRIGLELRWIERGTSGGIVDCLEGVLNTLIRRNPQHRFHVYGTPFSNDIIDFGHANATVEAIPLRDTWQALRRDLVRDGIEVLFRAYPSPDDLRFPLSKQVFFIPDLQHERFPAFFTEAQLQHRRAAFGRAMAGAGAIGTLSAFARQTIMDAAATRCRDIFLMPPALKAAAAPDPDARRALLQRLERIGPYFLFPANIWLHKNHARLIEALALFSQRGGTRHSLVLTGFPDQWPALAARFPGVPVHHLGYVSAGELELLYERATALTFFSLYEGFGMPLLEAFRAGCPVVCADTCSLPEVGGDAVLACDPTDAAAMAGAMERVARDDALRARLRRAGMARLPFYTWEKSADALMGALERVAAPKLAVTASPPLVSIVTPSFNQGRFLGRTIDSVLGQTYPNIEYVVMDGGSTDESVGVMRAYGERLRWRSERDRGQTHAINKGFAECRGEIRAYLNSDDTLLPDGVERAVTFLERHPTCDLVYGRANYIDADDRVTGAYNTADYSFARLMEDCCVCQPAAFWRDGIAQIVGPFDEAFDFAMDYDYWLRIALAGGHIAHLDAVLANSRLHPDIKTLTGRRAIYAEIFRTCLKHGGYVSATYYEGLWHHRLWERPNAVYRMLRRIPDAQRRIAAVHRVMIGANPPRVERAPPAASAATVATALALPAARWPMRRPQSGSPGFWPDGWLARRARFTAGRLEGRRGLYLVGFAPRDCRLSMRTAAKTTELAELHAGRITRIDVPPPETVPLELIFSGAARDSGRRELAFKLLATNLFLERDC